MSMSAAFLARNGRPRSSASCSSCINGCRKWLSRLTIVSARAGVLAASHAAIVNWAGPCPAANESRSEDVCRVNIREVSSLRLPPTGTPERLAAWQALSRRV